MIEHDQIVVDASEPVNITGHSCDLFVGQHATAGKVAMKRLRIAEQSLYEDDAIRVSI